MRIPRIHTPGPLAAGVPVALNEGAANHVVRVLRLTPGAPLVLFDGCGGQWRARFWLTAGRKKIIFKPMPRPFLLTLVLAALPTLAQADGLFDAVKQAADANLVTSLSMVLPFGPAEKQALLEAADSTARARLLLAFLEMNAFGEPSGRVVRIGTGLLGSGRW